MFGVNWMELLILIGTIGIGFAVLTYLSLRLFVWNKAESKSLEHIRKHALWTGIIAWAFSGLHSASRAGINDPNQFQPSHWQTIPWFAIIAPAAAVVAVHAIGQASWPAPKAAKRTAVLEFRRTRDYVQPALGWTTAGIFTLTAVVLGFLFFAPGFTGPNSVTLGDYGQSVQTHFGRAPGHVLASALTASLALLTGGTVLVMRLIASRRSLEALSPEQNKTLRIIGMNRLLRVSATVASGLAALAGNYLAQPAPDSTATSWVNWLGIVNAAVLIAMLFWKPPFLDSPSNDAGYNVLHVPGTSTALAADDGPAAAKLSNSASAALFPAAIIGAALGYALRDWLGLIGIVAMAAIFILLACLAMEIILRRNYADHGASRSKLRVLLPWPMYFAFALATVGLLLALVNAYGAGTSGRPNTWDGMDSPAAMVWVPGIAIAAILACGLLVARYVLARPGLTNAPPALDRTLRRRSLFRIARTVVGSYFAILGILLILIPVAPDSNPLVPRFESGVFGVLCNVLAVLVAFYPMRGFTPTDFMPATPPNITLSK